MDFLNLIAPPPCSAVYDSPLTDSRSCAPPRSLSVCPRWIHMTLSSIHLHNGYMNTYQGVS